MSDVWAKNNYLIITGTGKTYEMGVLLLNILFVLSVICYLNCNHLSHFAVFLWFNEISYLGLEEQN